MPKKKNNHIIPAGLIRQWLTTNDNLSGVHIYESASQRQYFSSDGGGKPFSFAIEKYYYVPKHQDERIYHLENWLADIESTLSIFIRALRNGATGPILHTRTDYHKLLLALFSMNTRSKFDIDAIKKYMRENPDIKKLVEMEKDRDIEIAALENMMNSTIELAIGYEQCEIVVCKNSKGNLILGDRPFLFEVLEGYSFLPLHPNFFISICKAKGSNYTYLEETEDNMIHLLNQKVAENSRSWLTSNNDKVLKKYIPFLDMPKDEAKPYFQNIQFLNKGYKLT